MGSTGLIRVWEHWKESGMSIPAYVDWLAGQKLSFQSFQRTARHYRNPERYRMKRRGGGTMIVRRERPFGRRQLELFDAIYARFGHYFGWFRYRSKPKGGSK